MAEFSLGDAVLGTAIDLTGLDQGLKDAEEKSRSGFAAIGDVIGGVLKVGLAVAAAGVAAAGAIVASGIADAHEAAQIMAQTEAVIASTGAAAERTAEQIADLATKLSDAAGASKFGDDQIQSAENLLLTFTNLKGEVFDLATAMTVDMAQALHKTPEDMALMVGKLLNSADAMSAAQRAGVSFSDEQLKLGKHLFETGRIAEYQKLVLGELNKEFGGSAAAAARADGGLGQFRARMGEAAETIGTAVLPLLNDLAGFLNSRVAPAIEGAAETIANLIPQLADFAADAFAWGANLGNEFASGLASAASVVISVLQQIGATIAYWLAPGSPPNLLPEIDTWGQQTAQAWLDGFGAADLGAIEDLGGQIRDVLQGLVKAGDFDEAGVIPAVLGSERAIADAIASADEFGNVSEDAIRGIVEAAGPAGPKVEGLVRAFFDLRRTTQDVARAQAELNRITAKYAEQIDPLSAEIQDINDQQQAIDDQIRVRDLQDEINDGKTDELTRQKDLLEIQEIGKRAELRGIERNRDAEVGAARTRLSAAEEAQQAAQDRLKDEQAAAESLTHQNELIGQQTTLLERMQQQAEAAAKAKGGAGGGGIDIPGASKPERKPGKESTGVGKEAEEEAFSFQRAAETLTGIDFDPIIEQFQSILDVVEPLVSAGLRPMIAIFEDAPDPITGFLDVLSTVSPTFELLRGVVEAALPPIESIVGSVFGIIGSLISEHGDTMLADVTETWTGIQAIIDGILPPIQSVVETVLGAIAQFLADHGDEIQAVLAKAWDTIAMVVDAALKLINATVVPAFEYIASFLSTHSVEIQQILGGAWDIIRSAIDIALTLIQGIITTALQVIQGDFSGAWTTIQTTNEQVWADIQTAISGAWEIIKGLVTTAIDGILTPILGMPEDVAGVGAAIINNIWDGLKAKWDEMVNWFRGKLQELRDMLPGSEPRDPSSPLRGLGAAGQATVLNYLTGLEAMAPGITTWINELTTAMLEGIGDLGEDARKELQKQRDELIDLAAGLAEQINAAISGAIGGQVDLGRAEERALGALSDFQGSIQDTLDKDQQARAKFAEDQLAEAQAKYEEMFNADPSKGQAALDWLDRRKAEILAQAETAGSLNEAQRAQLTELSAATRSQIDQARAEADKLAETDPEKAAAFFQMRQKQILELAKLQQAAALTTDATEQKRLQERIRLLEVAGQRERELFARQKSGNDSIEKLIAQVQALFAALPATDPSSPFAAMLFELTQLISELSTIGGLAGGTDFWPGGLSWVGEDGPELLNLPRGAQVLPMPALGGLAGGAAAGAPQRIEIDLSLNSRGLDWLERLIDARVDAKTSRAAGASDVRRRAR